MRSLFVVSVVAATALLSACASQETAPAPAPAPAAAAPAPAKKAPECWNGDAGAFQAVGTKTSISGVTVECKLTSDGKAAQWMGAKH